MRRSDWLRLLRNDTTAIFSTERDVFVHALVFLIEQTLLVVPRVICLEEELQLLFLDLLCQAFGVLFVSTVQQVRVVLEALLDA